MERRTFIGAIAAAFSGITSRFALAPVVTADAPASEGAVGEARCAEYSACVSKIESDSLLIEYPASPLVKEWGKTLANTYGCAPAFQEAVRNRTQWYLANKPVELTVMRYLPAGSPGISSLNGQSQLVCTDGTWIAHPLDAELPQKCKFILQPGDAQYLADSLAAAGYIGSARPQPASGATAAAGFDINKFIGQS